MINQPITIIGAGHAGYAAAAQFTLRGHEVRLYEMPQFKANLEPILERGGIELSGVAETGFAKIDKVTTDIGEAIKGIKLILVCTISNAHKTIAELCAPYLEDGQIVLLLPGNMNSLEFARVLKEKGVKKDVTIAESMSFLWPCRRVIGQAKVEILYLGFYKALAAFPAKDTQKVIKVTKEITDVFYPGKNVLEVALNNPNATFHVPGTILNTGYIEASGGKFNLNKQGTTPSVLKGMKAVNKERVALIEKLGYKDHIPFSESEKIHADPVFQKAWGPADLKSRYLTEDVPYLMVTRASLGEMIGVPTPVTEAFITIASILNETDYWKEGKTIEKLGISGLNVEQLNDLLYHG